MTIDWIVICGDIVNPQQISHVDPRVLGRFCGAPQELEFEDHVVIYLACGRKYRIRRNSESLSGLIEKLNLSSFFE